MSDYIIDQQNVFDDSDFLYEEYLKTQGGVNVSDWKSTFKTHADFCYALHHTKNPLHETAKTIKRNKDRNFNFNNTHIDLGQQSNIENYYSNVSINEN
jgi:hypothetical protein